MNFCVNVFNVESKHGVQLLATTSRLANAEERKQLGDMRSCFLTHGRFTSLTESVISESFHQAGLSHTAGADDNDLEFIIRRSGSHLPAARLRSHSGGAGDGAAAEAAAAAGPPLDFTPRVHP